MTLLHTLDNLLVHNYEWYDGSELDKLLHELTKYLPRLEDETFHIYAQQHIDGDTIKDLNSAIPAVVERLVKVQSILNHEGLGFPKQMPPPEVSSFGQYHTPVHHHHHDSSEREIFDRDDDYFSDSRYHGRDEPSGHSRPGRYHTGSRTRSHDHPSHGSNNGRQRRLPPRSASHPYHDARGLGRPDEHGHEVLNRLTVPGDDLRSIDLDGSLLQGVRTASLVLIVYGSKVTPHIVERSTV
ncbi:hypothetical protein FOZ60_012668 [Perkinsus olseni]|uniref:Uncharacterized protein n=1 Tax=Perkinsus olseni TaxID=32597 RepID=A0A7J6P9J5_PEROL|nr:hypothetical protein FOZ60_012668 [Perkinsus olseni]